MSMSDFFTGVETRVGKIFSGMPDAVDFFCAVSKSGGVSVSARLSGKALDNILTVLAAEAAQNGIKYHLRVGVTEADDGRFVAKAVMEIGELIIQAYGEELAKQKVRNEKGEEVEVANPNAVRIAEKRALKRVVLRLLPAIQFHILQAQKWVSTVLKHIVEQSRTPDGRPNGRLIEYRLREAWAKRSG